LLKNDLVEERPARCEPVKRVPQHAKWRGERGEEGNFVGRCGIASRADEEHR
jgi:hypothetical protein